MANQNEYLNSHNEREHNYHTNWEDSAFDVCIECDLIRRTGGLYEWKEEELVSMDTYYQGRQASRKFLPEGDDLVRQAEEDEVNGNKTARA